MFPKWENFQIKFPKKKVLYCLNKLTPSATTTLYGTSVSLFLVLYAKFRMIKLFLICFLYQIFLRAFESVYMQRNANLKEFLVIFQTIHYNSKLFVSFTVWSTGVGVAFSSSGQQTFIRKPFFHFGSARPLLTKIFKRRSC